MKPQNRSREDINKYSYRFTIARQQLKYWVDFQIRKSMCRLHTLRGSIHECGHPVTANHGDPVLTAAHWPFSLCFRTQRRSRSGRN